MAFKVRVQGRAKLTRDLQAIVPNALKYAAEANLQIVEQAAEKISAVAPRGATLEYAESIEGNFLRNKPDAKSFNDNPTKDPDAAGVFAPFIWRWLEFGTAPHNTAPGGGTLKGRTDSLLGRGHMHPGTTAQPHIWPTWRAFQATANRMKRNAINKAFREAFK